MRPRRLETVWKFVSRPPSQRSLTYGWPTRVACSASTSCACFFVPTKSTVPPWATVSLTKSYARSMYASDCCRSMMWMPERSVRMKRFTFGFQRRVWCPKWTPLSSSWRMVTTAMVVLLFSAPRGACCGCSPPTRRVGDPGVRRAPAPSDGDRWEDAPRVSGDRDQPFRRGRPLWTREVTPETRDAASRIAFPPRPPATLQRGREHALPHTPDDGGTRLHSPSALVRPTGG